jgi:hypothetical protein
LSVGTANTIFGNALAQKYLGDFSDEMATVGAVAAVVKCACEPEHANVASQSSVGVCLDDALCALDAFIFGNPCDCPPPPLPPPLPRVANCAATNAACVPWDDKNPVCRGRGRRNETGSCGGRVRHASVTIVGLPCRTSPRHLPSSAPGPDATSVGRPASGDRVFRIGGVHD